MMRIVADQEIPFVKEYFASSGELILKPGRSLEAQDLKTADLLLVRSVTEVNENLLEGSSVKWVGTVTTGLDHLDLAWLASQCIGFASAAGYNAEPVSDYVMAVLAALSEEGIPVDSLGLIGVGQVGSRIAKRLQALAIPTLLNDPPRAALDPLFPSVALSDLQNSSCLSLHTPLTKEGNYPSYHLLNQSFFKEVEAKKVLINTSRGAVIDSQAFKAQKDHWHYCFDVWEQEPQLDLELLSQATIATPHLAGYSLQCRYRGVAQIYQEALLAGWIKASPQSHPQAPWHSLSFAGQKLRWQEVVLAVFDPRVVTRRMKETLLKEPSKCATLFDSLRKEYIGESIKRHEFAYTILKDLQLADEDRTILKALGFTIKE